MRKRDFDYEHYGSISDHASSGHYGKKPRTHNREESPIGSRYGSKRPMQTSDPGSATARIFVGSLPLEVTQEMLEDHFSRWGEVVGATVTKHGFGFVQYRRDNEALACLSTGRVTMLDGFRLDIKAAKLSSGGPARSAPGGSHYGPPMKEATEVDWRNYGNGELSRDPKRGTISYDSYYNDLRESLGKGSLDRRDRGNGRPDRNESHNPYHWSKSDTSLHERGNHSSSLYSDPKLDLPPKRPVYKSASPDTVVPLEITRPNDVEIVVPYKGQREFAERIEIRLKQFDLTVDLLFPPPEVSADRVIRDLSARNCLYAIFTTAENEAHNSLTLNILHGDPQEHRNMPVEDAMRLIQQNFEEHLKKTRQRTMRDVVPRDIRKLLLELLEMRPLSMGDLDEMIKYLRMRQNALVDNQIEQKRETVGQKAVADVVNRSMAVTYPGYSYISAATAAIGQPAAPASIVPAPTVVTYPASAAYSTGLASVEATHITGVLDSAYRLPQVVPQPFAPPAAINVGDPGSKQAELQERILSLLKHQPGGVAQVPTPADLSSTLLAQQANLWGTSLQQPEIPRPRTDRISAYNAWTSL